MDMHYGHRVGRVLEDSGYSEITAMADTIDIQTNLQQCPMPGSIAESNKDNKKYVDDSDDCEKLEKTKPINCNYKKPRGNETVKSKNQCSTNLCVSQDIDLLASLPEAKDDSTSEMQSTTQSDFKLDNEDDDKLEIDGDEQTFDKYYDCSDGNIFEDGSSTTDRNCDMEVTVGSSETIAGFKDVYQKEYTFSSDQHRAPLKSILNTSSSRKNKGLKVSFHDAHIFFIDTDAQVSTEPQLLTLRAFDLPLALTEFSVLTSAFDCAPSLPPGSYEGSKHYTYEDAIVSFDDDNDTLVCHKPALACDTLDITNEFGLEAEDVLNLDCPLLSALQQESLANGQVDDGSQGNSDASEIQSEESHIIGLQSLTEANLKQHEILMEKNEEDAELTPNNSNCVSEPAFYPTSNGNSLSPPLKELTVDVQDLPNGNDASDDWQVELSPLNSIPESETGSSTSSQDTIIMMTSDESRRNEEHIQLSTDIYRKVKQGTDTFSVELDDIVPASVDEELCRRDSSLELQRSSDQIREILERNAVRRNHLRYSVKKKFIDGVPVEKQRQWRSHESLLDTIKKLTLDEDGMVDDPSYLMSLKGASTLVHDKSVDIVKIEETAKVPPSRKMDSSSITTSQDLNDQFAFPQDVQELFCPFQSYKAIPSEQTENVEVPKDLRQWKIRSNMWNSVNGAGIAKTSFMKRPGKMSEDVSLPLIGGNFISNHNQPIVNSGLTDDVSDELVQFVTQGSERIERIRRRYSYTDGDGDYEAVGAFARRPSVRGIKPRFGSTTEILNQMQSHLHSSLSNHACSHITWPYPMAGGNKELSTLLNFNYRKFKPSSYLPPTVPEVPEEAAGLSHGTPTTPSSVQRIPTYSNNNEYQPVYRTRRGRDTSYKNYMDVSCSNTAHTFVPSYQSPLPPPYQPPPAPSYVANASNSNRNLFQGRGERGVPEGASSSLQGPFDSIYRSQNQSLPSDKTCTLEPESNLNCKNEQFYQDPSENSGYVYYAMQV